MTSLISAEFDLFPFTYPAVILLCNAIVNNEANVRKVREPFVRVHGMTTFNIRIFWVKFAAWEMIYRIPNRVRGKSRIVERVVRSVWGSESSQNGGAGRW